MALEFDYREEKSRIFGSIRRPIAKIKVMHNDRKRWISQFFYIDSGADFTLIPHKLGIFLGFSISKDDKTQEVQGINGIVPVILRKAQLKIGEHEFSAVVGWGQIEHIPLLLGRLDVFNKFDITFKEADSKVVFEWKCDL